MVYRQVTVGQLLAGDTAARPMYATIRGDVVDIVRFAEPFRVPDVFPMPVIYVGIEFGEIGPMPFLLCRRPDLPPFSEFALNTLNMTDVVRVFSSDDVPTEAPLYVTLADDYIIGELARQSEFLPQMPGYPVFGLTKIIYDKAPNAEQVCAVALDETRAIRAAYQSGLLSKRNIRQMELQPGWEW
jgi:hypothetical protein